MTCRRIGNAIVCGSFPKGEAPRPIEQFYMEWQHQRVAGNTDLEFEPWLVERKERLRVREEERKQRLEEQLRHNREVCP